MSPAIEYLRKAQEATARGDHLGAVASCRLVMEALAEVRCEGEDKKRRRVDAICTAVKKLCNLAHHVDGEEFTDSWRWREAEAVVALSAACVYLGSAELSG